MSVIKYHKGLCQIAANVFIYINILKASIPKTIFLNHSYRLRFSYKTTRQSCETCYQCTYDGGGYNEYKGTVCF